MALSVLLNAIPFPESSLNPKSFFDFGFREWLSSPPNRLLILAAKQSMMGSQVFAPTWLPIRSQNNLTSSVELVPSDCHLGLFS
jgi:hypothetical protein